jgi:hypothetical protein
MVVASGYKARRIYIVPSLELVVVRLGAAPLPIDVAELRGSFDEKLWKAIMVAAPAD